MTHTGCVCVCVGSVSRLCICVCVCVSPVCQHPYSTVEWLALYWLCNDAQFQIRKCKLWKELTRIRSSFRCCTEMCLLPADNVGKLCFLRLLWLLNKHHLYVCLGVYSAKRCNPNRAAGSVCWMELECRGEAGLRLCLMCLMVGMDCREINWSVFCAFFVLCLCLCPFTIWPSHPPAPHGGSQGSPRPDDIRCDWCWSNHLLWYMKMYVVITICICI